MKDPMVTNARAIGSAMVGENAVTRAGAQELLDLE
jgi:hypothetical protein